MASQFRSTPDADLESRVRRFFYARGLSVDRVSISADRGVVTLRGSLKNVRDWELCVELCSHVAGVTRVVDELDVASDSFRSVQDTERPRETASDLSARRG